MLVGRAKIARVHGWGWLVGSLVSRVLSGVVTVAEGGVHPMLRDPMDLAEHGLAALHSLLLVVWAVAFARSRVRR
ncbi:MAG: hypothetical protein VX899_20045 [Myxococcota bacterium]|nr:hypothetical protein [Myxococcota bacterium]